MDGLPMVVCSPSLGASAQPRRRAWRYQGTLTTNPGSCGTPLGRGRAGRRFFAVR